MFVYRFHEKDYQKGNPALHALWINMVSIIKVNALLIMLTASPVINHQPFYRRSVGLCGGKRSDGWQLPGLDLWVAPGCCPSGNWSRMLIARTASG